VCSSDLAAKLFAPLEIMATCHLWYKEANRPVKMRVMIALELLFYRSFLCVVGVSDSICGVLADAGVPRENLQVIANGVQVKCAKSPSTEDTIALRRELGLPDGDRCIINTGRLTDQKAQRDIVSAAQILRDQGQELQFLIVGEGELEPDLRRQIASAELTRSVHLLGFRADIPQLLAIADLFVLPSLDEGMPMSLLEAAAVGLPAIVTEVGDIPKLITHKVSGRIVPAGKPQALAQAIGAHMENPSEGKKWALEAQAGVEGQYSNRAMFTKYDEVYGSLLGPDVPVESSPRKSEEAGAQD